MATPVISSFTSVMRYKDLKYWVDSCYQSTNQAEKILSRKMYVTLFLKMQKVLFGAVTEWSCISIRTKKFCKKGVTRSFAKFARQHLWQSLFFDKIRCCRSATSLKTRLQHRCFPVNFVKFVKIPFLQIATERMLLNIAVSIVVKGDWQTKL